jgi:predicted O-methyltransferase YrrM
VTATLDQVRASPVGTRARMTIPLARLAASSDPGAAPLRRALRTTLLGRVPAAERRWADRIEARRRELLADRATTGPSFDPGTAGPHGRVAMGHRPTTVGVACEFMSLSAPWCLLLMRLVRERSPRSCLELGTGLGISAAYQAAALELNGHGTLMTLEGSRPWAELAEEGLAALGLERATVRVGPIGERLAGELDRPEPLDLAFIDAEHQADSTLGQFTAMLPRLAPRALVIVDDVHWPAMKRAQAAIGRHARVSTSVSVGRLGISVIDGASAASP